MRQPEGIADDPTRTGVEHDRNIDEAHRDRDIGDIGHRELVGPVHLVIFCDERKDRPFVIAVGRAHEARRGLSSAESNPAFRHWIGVRRGRAAARGASR